MEACHSSGCVQRHTTGCKEELVGVGRVIGVRVGVGEEKVVLGYFTA